MPALSSVFEAAEGLSDCRRRTLLSVREAAERLGLKPATIRAWLLRRRLPRVNCGRAVRIPAEAIEKFIAEHTIPAREVRQ
jgi:excisionase family DNA binding protein